MKSLLSPGSRTKLGVSLLFFFVILQANPVFAVLSEASIVIFTDNNANGIADGYYDDTIICRVNSTAGAPTVNLQLIGLGVAAVLNQEGTSNYYSGSFTVGDGTYYNVDYTPTFNQALLSLTVTAGSGIKVDTYPPFLGAPCTAQLTTDVNTDGVAAIGDKITFTCTDVANHVTTGSTPYVQLTAMGTPKLVLDLDIGITYLKEYTVIAGGLDNNAYSSTFYDNLGTRAFFAPINVDNQRPTCPDGIKIVSQPNVYTINNNSLNFYVDFTDADKAVLPTVKANLSNLLLGLDVDLNNDGGGRYSLAASIPIGIENSAIPIYVTAKDAAGNEINSTLTKTVNVDTIAPIIQSVSASINGSPAWGRIGSVVRLTAVVSNYDNDILTVKVATTTITPFMDETPMIKISQVGNTATYQLEYTIAVDDIVQDNAVKFTVTASDNNASVGNFNVTTRDSNTIKIDTVDPLFNIGPRIVVAENKGFFGDSITVIGDVITASFSLTIDNTGGSATLDLSSIGGPSNLAFTAVTPATYTVTYTIVAGTSEDQSISRAFPVNAYDAAGNLVYSQTTPPIYVDNIAPAISGGQLSKIAGSGSTVKIGDTIQLQATVSFLDNGSVWADLRSVGASTGSDTLTFYSGSTYRLQFPVAVNTPPEFAVDQSKSFPIYVLDDAGNTVPNTVTNTLVFDNEPPVITSTTYIITPAIVPVTHPKARVGDKLEFRVSLASSGATVYDSQTVTINLSPLGLSANQAMTYDGVGSYTYTINSIPAGSASGITNFSVTAVDNGPNNAYTTIQIDLDNSPPIPSPMTISINPDVVKLGAINATDTVKFTVACTDTDVATAWLDLRLIGGDQFTVMPYNAGLGFFEIATTTGLASTENSSYYFTAKVTDVNGNYTYSTSSAYEVDCKLPVINSVNAAKTEILGNGLIANVGDKITITANIDLTAVDGGTPNVDLTSVGGNSAQVLYDDGAHDDGASGDGVYGYTFTVVAGSLDGTAQEFTVTLTDNAGNRVTKTTANGIVFDNKPLQINYFLVSTFDANSNSTVDLDGEFGATDAVRLQIRVTGTGADFPGINAVVCDLNKIGYSSNANISTYTSFGTYRDYDASYTLLVGNTNRESVIFGVTVTDVNGNISLATSTPTILVDSKPPSIVSGPILSFIVDNGTLNEANLNDIIRVQVEIKDHDSVAPVLDLTDLSARNGGVISTTKLTMTGGPAIYSYDWTVPPGLGTNASLPVRVFDTSRNMVTGWTAERMFLSRVPVVKGYPDTYCTLSETVPASNVANVGDKVAFRLILQTAYNSTNVPPATVAVNIRSIKADGNDDPGFSDGDPNTYWKVFPVPAPALQDWVYTLEGLNSITVEAGGVDVLVASFPYKVLHPSNNAIVLASGSINCNPANPWGIDTLFPNIYSQGIAVSNENNDNLSSSVANIGDTLTIWANVNNLSDPGSVSMRLLSSTSVEIYKLNLNRVGVTDLYSVNVTVATAGVYPWTMAMQGAIGGDDLRYSIYATDDADNLSNQLNKVSTFTVDNKPTLIASYINVIKQGGTGADLPFLNYANIATGTASDSFIASMAVDITPYQAWVDLSAMEGSSTQPIVFSGGLTGISNPLLLATSGIPLQQFNLPIHLRDAAGNYTSTSTALWVDTQRPTLASVSYDGEKLRFLFSENLKLVSNPNPPVFDQTTIRIGKENVIHPFNPSSMLRLSAADTVATPTADTNWVDVILASTSRAIIADWGETDLWLTMGYDLDGTSLVTVVCRDLAGNPLVPIPAQPSTTKIGHDPLVLRPNLVDGLYDANTPSKKGNLYLTFDRSMATDTFTNLSLNLLSVVKNSSYDGYPRNYAKRYVMQGEVAGVATDVVTTPVSNITLVASLSLDAQDWIAMKFGNTAFQISLGIQAPIASGDPALCRDIKGNQVNPVPFITPKLASLTPYNLPFNLQNPRITVGTDTTILHLEATSRMRLFQGEDQFNPPSLWPKTTPNVNPGKIYIFKNANRTESSLSLSRSTLDPVLNGYSSSAVNLTLNPEETETILGWNTTNLYISVEQGAFKDLWSNQNNQYLNGVNAWPLPPLTPPSNASKPKMIAYATSDATPIKDYTSPGALYYEIEVEQSTLPQSGVLINVPLNRDSIPTLWLQRGDTAANIEVASFTTWRERIVGGKKRVIARFNCTGSFLGKPLDRVPSILLASGVRDVFGLSADPTPGISSYTYWIGHQSDAGDGYGGNASAPLVIDTEIPEVFSVVPTGTIGITPIGAATFTVTFDEPMDTTLNNYPVLVLRRDAAPNSIDMSFTFQQWVKNASGTASQAVYVSNSPFDNNTYQGPCHYYVSGGYDLAGNVGNTDQQITSGTLDIKSAGPNISNITVTTYQTTVATAPMATGYSTNKPFSPDVPPNSGIATITIFYGVTIAPTGVGVHEMHVYDGETFRASYPITIDPGGSYGIATFAGRDIAGIIGSGPTTFNLRIIDGIQNEGTIRGNLVYDAVTPKLTSWTISKAKLRSDGKYYFSPAVHSYAQIDIGDLNQSENSYLRVTNPTNPITGNQSTDTYLLSQWTGYGHTIQFNGKSATKTGNPPLAQNSTDTFKLHVVDEAGNLGVSGVVSDQSSATLIIDNTNPAIVALTLHRFDTKVETARINPRVTNLEIRVATSTADLETAPGKAFVRLKSGSTVVRDDLALTPVGTVLAAVWDGTNGSGTLVTDGTYQVEVVDLAENPAAITKTVEVVTSIFTVSSANEIDKNKIQVTFSHDVNTSQATDGTRYTVSGSTGNMTIGAPLTMVGSKTVSIPLSTPLVHGTTYVVTVALSPVIYSYDGDPLSTGNNVVTMTPDPADVQGPTISKIDYTGVTGARQFNIVFGEQIATSSANNTANFSLTTSTDTVPIDSVALQTNGTTVLVTTQRDIVEGVTYTVAANGVEDSYKNKSTSTINFTGKDVTPPQLTVSVFSNPANEYDIAIVVKSNEDLSGNPTATVTQSGGNSNNITLNAGPGNRLFMGGTLLDKNYSGSAVVQVTATDKVGNSGTSTPVSFTTAYVSASIRADVRSGDGKLVAVFVPGSLKEDSFVTILPLQLAKVGSNASQTAGIKATVFADLKPSEFKGLNLAVGEGKAADELSPLDTAYTINVPNNRISNPYGVFYRVGEENLPTGVGLFHMDENGVWQFVSRNVVKGWLTCETTKNGAYALMKDSLAPRANMMTKVDWEKPFKDPRPGFEWKMEELGAGLEADRVKVVLNGEEFPAVVDGAKMKAVFRPIEPLPGGEHRISLKVSDKTQNVRTTQEILFLIQPPLVIHEITQFPNPARSRTTLRVGTNRPDITSDMIEVTIYDSSGQRVRGHRGFDFVARSSGSRKLHEMNWDLTNDSGKKVANGVYFAKVTVHDPDNLEKKTKVIHKIAVLR